MNAFFQTILNLLYPPKCAFCRSLVSSERMICPDCEKKQPFTDSTSGRRMLGTVSLAVAPFKYEGSVRDALLRYKFHGLSCYSGIFGEFMAKEILKAGIEADMICWIPLSKARLRKRGYDQARLLAEEIADILQMPCCPLLEKTKHNSAQSGMAGKEERIKNVSGVYLARANTVIQGKKILLIDDIITTGATMEEAAKELMRAGAACVYGAAAAMRQIGP